MTMGNLQDRLQEAVASGMLLEASAKNISIFLDQSGCETWERESIEELVDRKEWVELNDRFFKALKFGTGGLRGRTIGKVITSAEKGDASGTCPLHPAVGSNCMNTFNVGKATQGLVAYLKKQFTEETPRLVISHDTRHFSRFFAEQVAEIAMEMGVDAFLFEAERSTPELSFAVRYLEAHGGVMLTASHNPPHDNGYKVYFQDGGQIVEPHASGIIDEVMAVTSGKVKNPAEEGKRGKKTIIGKEVDDAYLNALSELVLEPDLVQEQSSRLKVVFTPIHGTGIQSIPSILDRFQFSYSVVENQKLPDGNFPTVTSPNPENAEALAMGIEQAEKEKADLVIGTDPDADRMGAVVRGKEGDYEIITGNQIGSVMGAYRLERMFAQGILNRDNASRAALIKTFVTTDLQKEMANAYGIKCVETLTGFKYIGEKLKEYDEQAGGRGNLNHQEWQSKRLEKSTLFVFGGEESYGYAGGDYARDKDANAAVLMLAEVASYVASQGKTILDYLDDLYVKYGFYWEKLGTLVFEGAEGAAKIKKLLDGYKSAPPTEWGGLKVEKIQNFAEEKLHDVDGKTIPKELMLIFYLEKGFRIAVRASGTEPKIKFYFFGKSEVEEESQLQQVKAGLKERLEKLWEETQNDVQKRVQ